MVGKGQAKIVLQGKAVNRKRLRLGQRPRTDIVSGSGGGIAHAFLDLFGFLPAGGVLQVQVHPVEVRFPAQGEADIGVVGCPLAGAFVPGAAVQQAGDQVHPIRVDHRDKGKGGPPEQLGGVVAVKGIAVQQCQTVFLQEGHQNGGGDPLVGVVAGVVKDLRFALPDGDRPKGLAHGAAADGPDDQVRVAQLQAGQAQLQQLGGEQDPLRHHGKAKRHRDGLPGAQILRVQGGVGGADGGYTGIVLLGKLPEGVPRLRPHKPHPRQPGRQRLPHRRIAAAGNGQILLLLEAPEGHLGTAAEAAVRPPGAEPRPDEAQLQQLHPRPPAAKSIVIHVKTSLCQMFYCMTKAGADDTGRGYKISGKTGRKVLTKRAVLCIISFVGTEWMRLFSVI